MQQPCNDDNHLRENYVIVPCRLIGISRISLVKVQLFFNHPVILISCSAYVTNLVTF